jgi:hypothetical protein
MILGKGRFRARRTQLHGEQDMEFGSFAMNDAGLPDCYFVGCIVWIYREYESLFIVFFRFLARVLCRKNVG